MENSNDEKKNLLEYGKLAFRKLFSRDKKIVKKSIKIKLNALKFELSKYFGEKTLICKKVRRNKSLS